MGYLKIKCHSCGGTWEVYSRDIHNRYDRARRCPFCDKSIEKDVWNEQVIPTYLAMSDTNMVLSKEHTQYHRPLFEISYESTMFFKDAKVVFYDDREPTEYSM